jgi:hypothetical protein
VFCPRAGISVVFATKTKPVDIAALPEVVLLVCTATTGYAGLENQETPAVPWIAYPEDANAKRELVSEIAVLQSARTVKHIQGTAQEMNAKPSAQIAFTKAGGVLMTAQQTLNNLAYALLLHQIRGTKIRYIE